ncbi:hypothetical protein GCM10023170_000430 [Phytohabitans houttuyneae]|uniref:Uncharacterized protein n=1 Tax=Phytohabitans houttuyneae TaxID=1076126 RepID=A0A6V8JZW5_9ACTN|nr:hypothetical protein Phou_025730 [Phytohabitans houttuyneae]
MGVSLQSEKDDRVVQRLRQPAQGGAVGRLVAQAHRAGERGGADRALPGGRQTHKPAAAVARVRRHLHEPAGGEPVEELAERGRVHHEPLPQRRERHAVRA